MKHLTEVRKAHEAWKEEEALQKAKYEKQVDEFNIAEKAVEALIENRIRLALSEIDLPFSITVFNGLKRTKIEVKVQRHNNESIGFYWEWSISLYDLGKLEKESNSWSGMQAITQEQISSLRKTVDALEILNNLDWMPIFNENPFPLWEDYVTEESSIGNMPNFQREEKEALIKDIIGTETFILVDIGNKNRGVNWVQILKDTGKQYQISYIPYHYIKGGALKSNLSRCEISNKEYCLANPIRMSYEKFIAGIQYPFQFVQIV